VGKINPFGGHHIPIGFMLNYDMINHFFSLIYENFPCVRIKSHENHKHIEGEIFSKSKKPWTYIV
jgi:hypothetical protein